MIFFALLAFSINIESIRTTLLYGHFKLFVRKALSST